MTKGIRLISISRYPDDIMLFQTKFYSKANQPVKTECKREQCPLWSEAIKNVALAVLLEQYVHKKSA